MTRKKVESPEDVERLRTYRREYMRRRYKANPDAARAVARAAYWKNPEKYREKTREQRMAKPEVVRARVNDWAKRNKERLSAYREKTKERRAALAKARGRKPLTEEQKLAARVRVKEWLLSNRERAKKYREEYSSKNADASRVRTRKWAQENPGRARALSVERKARKLNATPTWANRFFISEIYDLCKRRNDCKTGGVNWHVDHIVPLRSAIVCGLHVEHNLRVIPAVENMKKHNSHWPGMP